MKIDYLKINGFGKIENKEIEFGKKINLILGKNEAGKTTLLKCISAMFYGLSKNKNGKDISDIERYKPWGNAEFSGKMKYTLDSGEKIEIFRDFSKKNPKIFNENSEDISKQFTIDKSKGNQFFFEQTKIDEEMLFATGLVEQQKVVLDDDEKSTLTQKITNILTSGEENISYKKAIEKLNKDLIEKIGTERTVGRPINVIQEKLENILNKKQKLEGKEERKTEIDEEKRKTTETINNLQQQSIILKELNNILKKDNIEQEKIKVKQVIVDDYQEKIDSLKDTQSTTENSIIQKIIAVLIFMIISIGCFLINRIIGTFITVAFIIGYLIYTLVIHKKRKDSAQLLEKEIKILEKNKNEKEDEINKDKEKIGRIKQGGLSALLEKVDFTQKSEIQNLRFEELEKEISNIENNINNYKIKLNTLEIEEKSIAEELDEKAQLEEELENAKQEKEDLENEAKKIKIAKEMLEKAYKKMKAEITPKLMEELSKIAAKISNNKYTNVKLNEEEGLLVELQNGEYININRLSAGTIDQLYLSLRLSAFKEITKESIPIILDESFAYYDNERLRNTLRYLNENFKENQIIIYTCTDREQNILDKEQIKYNLIRL